MADSYNLARFVHAQDPVFEQVCTELRRGRKQSHWMWFVFPQIAGLGDSPTARHYAITSREEAEAYLRHEVLGPRLRECTQIVVALNGPGIEEIFGYPDYLKFRSSMTLFSEVSTENQIFKDALQKYFDGKPDPLTLERL